MEMATNHRRINANINNNVNNNNNNHNNNNIVQVHHPLKQSKSKQRHHAQTMRHGGDSLPNGPMVDGAATMCGSNCRYYYETSQSPTFPDLTPPRDMPTPHKSSMIGRKQPPMMMSTTHHQFVDDPDTIEFCVDDETAATSAKYFKNSSRRSGHPKSYDPQVRWSRNNITATMERFQPMTSPSSTSESSSCTSHQDYSYAYYEPGAVMCHSNIPTPDEVAGPSTMPPPNSMRALLMKTKERQQQKMANRHTYQSRYGTHENIYEDVSEEKHNRLVSSAQSLTDRGCTKKEFQHILNNHYRVLEELNLSVEELLMSSSPPTNEPSTSSTPVIIKRTPTVQSCVVDTLGIQMTALDLKDDHMKSGCGELVMGEDSGFSGSSSGASYIGSLRNYKTAITRSLRRSSAPTCPNGAERSNGTVYGSCRTAKYPPIHPNGMRTMSNGPPIYNTNAATSIKIKHEKVNEAQAKGLKFSLWNRRS